MEQIGQITTRYPVAGNNLVDKIDYTFMESEQGRVWINRAQYFTDVPLAVWGFHIGGYQVCQKWLKDRKGRTLDFHDIQQYQRIIAALTETINLMEQVDATVAGHGGWPLT